MAIPSPQEQMSMLPCQEIGGHARSPVPVGHVSGAVCVPWMCHLQRPILRKRAGLLSLASLCLDGAHPCIWCCAISRTPATATTVRTILHPCPGHHHRLWQAAATGRQSPCPEALQARTPPLHRSMLSLNRRYSQDIQGLLAQRALHFCRRACNHLPKPSCPD
jgi:hypothetical protein